MAADAQLAPQLFVTARAACRSLPSLTSAHLSPPRSSSLVTMSDETGLKRYLARSLRPDQLKRNPSLIPLLAITAAGGVWAVYYLFRLAARGPEVMWNRHKNPEPWNEYSNKQYKFYSTIDHSKIKNERPQF